MAFCSGSEDEARARVGAQKLVRHLGLCHFVERLTSAVQWNDVVDLDTLQRCDRVAHIVLLVRREVEPADHRVNLADTRSRLGLFDCVDYPAMAARRQHDQPRDLLD